jgi:N utilization substance protein A
MKLELKKTIEFVGQEKNLTREQLLEALKAGLMAAAEKKYGQCDFEINYLSETDEFELFRYRTVVADEKLENNFLEISLSEARQLDASVQLGDDVGDALSTEGLGRIAAQFAKKTVMQKLTEAEKNTIFEEFNTKKGELVVGTVRRFDEGDIIVDLGHSEALLPYKEQIPGERFRYRDRLVGYIIDVKRYTRGPQITLSRTHPGMLAALFAQEVAEVKEGTVEIKAVARVPGKRAKIAVWSDDPSVTPVGACIGVKGIRIQNIIQELNGEQIDVIQYDEEPARFVCNALTPAEVSRIFLYEHLKVMEVILDDDQLSLAIGKRGQNVSLASTLTGWKIDIRSQTRLKELVEKAKINFSKLKVLDPMRAEILINEGYRDLQELSKLEPSYVMQMLNFTESQAEELLNQTHDLLQFEYGDLISPEEIGNVEREKQLLELIMEELKQKETPLEKIPDQGNDPLLDEKYLREMEALSRNSFKEVENWMGLRGIGYIVSGLMLEKNLLFGDFKDLDVLDLKQKTGLPTPFLKKLKLEITSKLSDTQA